MRERQALMLEKQVLRQEAWAGTQTGLYDQAKDLLFTDGEEKR